ncbi:MAG: transcriptional regulator, partial [Cyanobacteria bacterium J06560_2]
EFLREQLQDPEMAAEYLSAAIEDSSVDEFLLALQDVTEACGGIGVLAHLTEPNRQNAYKMLSEDGTSALTSLLSVLRAVGLTIKFSPDEKEAA